MWLTRTEKRSADGKGEKNYNQNQGSFSKVLPEE